MKGFLAAALAAVPDLVVTPRSRPVHLAFSYDEEIGCSGVWDLTSDLASRGLKADLCIVGEPTGMLPVVGHKSGRAYRCTVKGLEAHSSLTPYGVNAIEAAALLIAEIRGIGQDFAAGPHDDAFDVGHSTISVGMIEGGTGINIVPSHCSFVFEYRLLADENADAVFERVRRLAEDTLLPDMRSVHADSDISFERLYDYPAHKIAADHDAVKLVGGILGSNRAGKVAYGTEAGIFQLELGVPTVICGPGHIAVAHKPDEYVEQEQLDRCDRFLKELCSRHD
jgi:acetylornithine deacetylase